MGRFLQQDRFAGIPTSPQSLHKYSYAHTSPAWHTDPSGNVIPFLVAAAWLWGAAEVGFTIYDTYTTADTLLDPCVSGWEKVATGALWIAGIFLPGGGYASGGKAVVRQLDHVDEVADALYHVDEFIGASDELAAAGKALDSTTGALDDAADVAHSVEQVDDADALLQVADDLPCVPGNSFVAGTLVESSHGLVPIETLVVGDTVWAIDPQTHQAGYYPITWTTAHTATFVIALTVSPLTDTLGLAQEQIQVTDHHPFWVYGRGWIDAGKLRVGDRLLGDAGYTIIVVNVDVELQPVMVYNFTVDTIHTYTIGHAGILVHNTGCDIPELQGTARGGLLKQVKDFLRTFEGSANDKVNAIESLYNQVGQKSSTRWQFERIDLPDGHTIFEGPGGFHTVVSPDGKIWKGGPADYAFDRETLTLFTERLHDFFE